MKNKNQFSIIVLVSFFCFFITGCKSDVKQDYKDAEDNKWIKIINKIIHT